MRPLRGSSTALTLLVGFTGDRGIAGVVGAAIAMPAVGGVTAIANSAIDSFESYPSELVEPRLQQRSDRHGRQRRAPWPTVYEQNRVIVGAQGIARP